MAASPWGTVCLSGSILGDESGEGGDGVGDVDAGVTITLALASSRAAPTIPSQTYSPESSGLDSLMKSSPGASSRTAP